MGFKFLTTTWCKCFPWPAALFYTEHSPSCLITDKLLIQERHRCKLLLSVCLPILKHPAESTCSNWGTMEPVVAVCIYLHSCTFPCSSRRLAQKPEMEIKLGGFLMTAVWDPVAWLSAGMWGPGTFKVFLCVKGTGTKWTGLRARSAGEVIIKYRCPAVRVECVLALGALIWSPKIEWGESSLPELF